MLSNDPSNLPLLLLSACGISSGAMWYSPVACGKLAKSFRTDTCASISMSAPADFEDPASIRPTSEANWAKAAKAGAERVESSVSGAVKPAKAVTDASRTAPLALPAAVSGPGWLSTR
jgi:hypothetical protein